MAGYNKSNKAKTEERIIIVMDAILSGLKRREILQNIADNNEKETDKKKKWNVQTRQVDYYIEAANKQILDITKEEKEVLVSKAFAKYAFIYKKLIHVKDYKGAITAIEKSCSLLGLNAPEKIIGDLNVNWTE